MCLPPPIYSPDLHGVTQSHNVKMEALMITASGLTQIG